MADAASSSRTRACKATSSAWAATWRGRRYWVEVIGTWYLQDRWRDAARHSDRHYYRVVTADH